MLSALAMATSLELPMVATHCSDPVSLSTKRNEGPEKGLCTSVSAKLEILGAPTLVAPGKGDVLRGTLTVICRAGAEVNTNTLFD